MALNTELFSGVGTVYFSPLDPVTGLLTAPSHLGNVTEMRAAIQKDEATHYENQTPSRAEDQTLYLRPRCEITLQMEDFSRRTLAVKCGGSVIDIPAGPITNEPVLFTGAGIHFTKYIATSISTVLTANGVLVLCPRTAVGTPRTATVAASTGGTKKLVFSQPHSIQAGYRLNISPAPAAGANLFALPITATEIHLGSTFENTSQAIPLTASEWAGWADGQAVTVTVQEDYVVNSDGSFTLTAGAFAGVPGVSTLAVNYASVKQSIVNAGGNINTNGKLIVVGLNVANKNSRYRVTIPDITLSLADIDEFLSTTDFASYTLTGKANFQPNLTGLGKNGFYEKILMQA